MAGRQFGLYFAWNRPGEIEAELGNLDNRFPALFEFRRMLWPAFEALADPARFDQGIKGFLDDVILSDFRAFTGHVRSETGNAVRLVQRRTPEAATALDADVLAGIDTLIVVSLDHLRTAQQASAAEVAIVGKFLDEPDHTVVVCPHHDIGNVGDLPPEQRLAALEVEFRHHGDRTIPPQQRFGGFGRSLLEGLGVAVSNRYGLSPARAADGSPAPLEVDAAADRFGLLEGVTTFNLHPHLPHFEAPAATFDVLARQPINPGAPPHPFVQQGWRSFDALLQARAEFFAARLLVCDATMWSSAFGGLASLRRFWSNLARLPRG